MQCPDCGCEYYAEIWDDTEVNRKCEDCGNRYYVYVEETDEM